MAGPLRSSKFEQSFIVASPIQPQWDGTPWKWCNLGLSRTRTKVIQEGGGLPEPHGILPECEPSWTETRIDYILHACRRHQSPVTRSSFQRIVSRDIKYHPFRIEIRHELLPRDLASRTDFCQWLVQRPRGFMPHLVIGDEANFHLNGEVTTENVRQYAPKGHPPANYTYIRRNSRDKLGVWAALVGDGSIIGPFFFPRESRRARLLGHVPEGHYAGPRQ